MNWNNLQTLWNSQEPPGALSGDPATVRRSFEAKSRRTAASLFWRDTREALAGLFMSGFFAYVGWQKGRAYWPIGLAVLLGLGVAAFFIRERLRAARNRVGPEAPLLVKLEADIAEMRHQRMLLLNVARWNLAPIMTAWAIVLVTVVANNPPSGSRARALLACYIAACGLLTWGIWALNRRVARRSFEPRIAELERLRDSLLLENPPEDGPSPGPSSPPGDRELLANIRADSLEFDAMVLKRDSRHLVMGSGLALILCLGVETGRRSPQGVAWPFVAGIVCLLTPILVLLAETTRARRRRKANGPSLAGELAKARMSVERQVRLLRRVAAWYIVPVQSAWFLAGLGAAITVHSRLTVLTSTMLVLWAATLVHGAVNTYHANQDAVDEKLLPRLDRLNQLITRLPREDKSAGS